MPEGQFSVPGTFWGTDPDFNGRCRVRLDDGGDEKLVKRQNVGLLLGPAIAEFF